MKTCSSLVAAGMSLFLNLAGAVAEQNTACPAYQEAVRAHFAPICLGGGDGAMPTSAVDAVPASFAFKNEGETGAQVVYFVSRSGKDRRAYFCRSGAPPQVASGIIREYLGISDAEVDRLAAIGQKGDYAIYERPAWRISCQGEGDAPSPAPASVSPTPDSSRASGAAANPFVLTK